MRCPPVVERAARLLEPPRDAEGVDVGRVDVEPVARARGDQRAWSGQVRERAPEARDRDLGSLRRALHWTVLPDLFDELVDRDGPSAVQGQEREQCELSRAAEVQPSLVAAHLDRTQEPEPAHAP
jgi:hypothetical protein